MADSDDYEEEFAQDDGELAAERKSEGVAGEQEDDGYDEYDSGKEDVPSTRGGPESGAGEGIGGDSSGRRDGDDQYEEDGGDEYDEDGGSDHDNGHDDEAGRYDEAEDDYGDEYDDGRYEEEEEEEEEDAVASRYSPHRRYKSDAPDSVGRSSGTHSVEHAMGAGALTAESRRILARQSQHRVRIKQRMLNERRVNAKRKQTSRMMQVDRWRRKTSKSPFAVDLLAEHERMDEEMRVRVQEQARREKLLAKRREQVKAEIIVKALAEESDLEALRAEKRAILKEEQRLKALLELEKAKLHRKADMQAAVRAERQRARAKKEYRRDKYAALQNKRQETIRLQNMMAQGLIRDPKTGHTVPLESDEGWFALQEMQRAGTLPKIYEAYMAKGKGRREARGASPGLVDASESRAGVPVDGGVSLLSSERSPARRPAGRGGRDAVAEPGSMGPPVFAGGEGQVHPDHSLEMGSADGGMVLAGRVQGAGDAIDAMAEPEVDEGDYEDDYEDEGVGERPSEQDASAALSRLQGTGHS